MHVSLSWEAPWYCPRPGWLLSAWNNAEDTGLMLLGLSIHWMHNGAAGLSAELALYIW